MNRIQTISPLDKITVFLTKCDYFASSTEQFSFGTLYPRKLQSPFSAEFLRDDIMAHQHFARMLDKKRIQMHLREVEIEHVVTRGNALNKPQSLFIKAFGEKRMKKRLPYAISQRWGNHAKHLHRIW